ncbi:MAG TPA: choice-of-anchor Q domain-containing protein [Solirubrobacterales bacterium]
MLHSRFNRRRAAGGRALAGLATIALLVFGVTAAPAAAEDRYVTPGGKGELCSVPSPCDLDIGINKAEGGDTVRVAGDLGAYLGISVQLLAVPGVSVIGEGQQVPRIVFENLGTLFVSLGASATRLDLSRTSGPSAVASIFGTGSRLRAESPSSPPVGLTGLLRDSFVHATAPEAPAVVMSTTDAKLRNVTAVADGAGSAGIRALSFYDIVMMKCFPLTTVDLGNVIARGAAFDLQAVGGGETCPATINVAHSNYRGNAVSLLGVGGVVVDQGGNQTSIDPLLAPDGLHQLAGSPTIDAGIGTPENGSLDIDGEPRTQGAAPDIGADESVPPPAPVATPDTTAPVGSKLRFAPRRFRPRQARTPSLSTTSAKKRRKRSPQTSRVSYRLSEEARVSFSVQRRVIGRKKGKRCLIGKRARRLRKARKCRRFVRVKGGFSHVGGVGTNRFRFSGYVRGRRLRPGVYRMSGVPADAAGNRGRRFSGSFVIARR